MMGGASSSVGNDPSAKKIISGQVKVAPETHIPQQNAKNQQKQQ